MRDNIKLALASIRANKMRAALTMLGIIIGIASVIAIMTIGQAMKLAMQASMASMGVNNLTVSVEQTEIPDSDVLSVKPVVPEHNGPAEMADEALLSVEMLDGLQTALGSTIDGLSYSADLGSGSVSMQHNTTGVSVLGANKDFMVVKSIANIEIKRGHWLTDAEIAGEKRVAVIQTRLAEALFGSAEDALGKQFDITLKKPVKTVSVTVVGIYDGVASKGGNVLTGNYSFDFSSIGDSRVYLPVTTALSIVGKSGVEGLSIAGVKGSDVNALDAAAQSYFDKRYHAKGYETSIDVPSPDDMMDSTMDTLQKAFSAIGAISLLVGGIGVMNIMMVSITERTREIGVRKALGAKRRDIRMQFIVESVVLSFIGGVIGIIVGMIGGNVAAKMMGYGATASLSGVLLAFGFSLAIGVFFGFYPANKAAKMNPIDALRYE
ncbi:MAG: ABC transporter permease [Ruthenibacterium sp.]